MKGRKHHYQKTVRNICQGLPARSLAIVVVCMAIFFSMPVSKPMAALDVGEIRRQAELGNPEDQFQLGFMYRHGIKVARNNKAAREWYTRAAEQGHPKAQNNLGVMYVKGLGGPKNYQKAIYWYKKAADNGINRAASSLAGMYLTGMGVEVNGWKAIEWYGVAAYHGDWRAQHDIGLIYKQGSAGVPVDLVRAYAWYMVAAIHGGPVVERLVKNLAARMTPEQIEEGKKLSEAIWSNVDPSIQINVMDDPWLGLLFGPYLK